MIRVWSEHLPLSELRAPHTLRLLAQEQVHPIVAVRPTTGPAELARTIVACKAAGLEPGIWPLLGRADGYWPSERNIAAWATGVDSWLDELRERHALPSWLAADLEPPIGQTAQLLRRTWDLPLAAAQLGAENMDSIRFHDAERALRRAVANIRERGVRTLGITLPLAAHDLRDGTPFWQDLFETPWARIGWDVAGIMAYGSIISGASQNLLSPEDARAIHQRLLDRVGTSFGSSAHASIGVTGAGVFGNEPAWNDPEELYRDACGARSAGISDIGIFCLEGVLDRSNPETWLRAVTRARPIVPRTTWKARAARHIATLLRTRVPTWFAH